MVNPSVKELYIYTVSLIIIGAFLYCGIYALPAADDFFYSNLIREAGFLKGQIAHYEEWSGRYAATFLITLFSLTNFEQYWLVPLTCILSLLFSFHFFCWTILFDSKDKKKLFLLVLSFIAMFLSVTTAGYGHGILVINEGFFWFSGAVTYIMALSFYLILLSCLTWLHRKKFCILNYSIVLFLSCLVVGLNETAMFLVFISVIPLLIYQRKKFGNFIIVSLIITICLCCALVFFAPGNDVRMTTSDGGNILSAIGVCIEKIVQIFFYYLFNPFIWLFVILFSAQLTSILGFLSRMVSTKRLYLLGALLVFALYFPIAYALNSGPPDRLMAFIGFFALIMSLFYANALLPLITRKVGSPKRFVLLVTFFAIIGSYYFVEPLRIAAGTVFTGHEFYQLHQKRKEKVIQAKQAGNRTVKVDFIERNPLLLFEDLLPNSNNDQYAKFYGVKRVIVKAQKSKIKE